eukprot:6181167-Pleurochrysis_carterae.AAC.8
MRWVKQAELEQEVGNHNEKHKKQPDFTALTSEDTPEVQWTNTPTAGEEASLEDTPQRVTRAKTQRGNRGEREHTHSRNRVRNKRKWQGKGRERVRRHVMTNRNTKWKWKAEKIASRKRAQTAGGVGEEKEQWIYWKEVEKKVERGVSETLEKAHAVRYAIYEAQVQEIGEIIDLASSEGEEEGETAKRGRGRRKEREAKMEERRARRAQLH